MFDLLELLTKARDGFDPPPGFDDFVDAAADDLTRAACSVIRSIFCYHSLDLDGTMRWADRAASTYLYTDLRSLDQVELELHVPCYWSMHTTRGLALDDLGKVEETLLSHRAALAFAEEFGYERGIVISNSNLGFKHLFAGATTDAVFVMLNPRQELSPDYKQLMDMLAREVMAYVCFGSGLREQAREQLRAILSEAPGLARVDRTLQTIDLAMMEISLGEPQQAQLLLDSLLVRNKQIASSRISDAVTVLQSVVLAARGLRDEAFALFDSVVPEPSQHIKYSELLLSDLAKVEMLAAMGSWDEVRAHTSPPSEGMSSIYTSRLLELKTESMARLGRWQEAVDCCRKAEAVRQIFDLDPKRYAALIFASQSTGSEESWPIGVTGGEGSTLHKMLAHDLRNRFNSVQLALELVELADGPQELLARLAQLETVLESVQAIPRNVMAYMAGLDRSAAPLFTEEQLSTIAISTVQRFQLDAEAKNISLRIAPSAEGTVIADREMLETCLCNLLGNAIKFTPMFGEVALGWRFAARRAGTTAAPTVEIYVDDDGPGLTEDDLKRIFTGPNRLSARPTSGEQSTGIGLTIISRLAKALGATVTAANGPSGGARFSISLEGHQTGPEPELFTVHSAPHSEPDPPGTDQLPAGPTPGDSGLTDRPFRRLKRRSADSPASFALRVLVFDDDPATREVVSEILVSAGAEVLAARSYSEAFNLATRPEGFDLFMIDYMIDGEPIGYRFAKLAKKLWPQARVALASGYRRDEVPLDRSAEIDYLRKPLRMKQLQTMVSSVAEQISTGATRADRTPNDYDLNDQLVMMEILREVAEGRRLPPMWTTQGIISPHPIRRLDFLVVASIDEASRGNHLESLELGLQARTILDQTATQRPIEVLWHLYDNLGTVHGQLGQNEEALEAHREALELSRREEFRYGETRSTIKLAETYSALGQSEKAVATLVDAMGQTWADRPARAKLLQVLGLQLLNQKATELAIVQLRKALQLFSSLNLDETNRTLHYLGLAYLEAGEYERLSLVISQLDRIKRTVGLPPPESANLESMRAAERLYLGRTREALATASAAMDVFRSTTINSLSRIAVITEIAAMEQLGLYRQVVDEWGQPEAIPRSARTHSAHRAIARSAEKVGEFEIAYHHELLANEMRRNHNRGLPHLIALAKDLSVDPGDRSEPIQVDTAVGVANPVGLTKPINAIKDLTQTLGQRLRTARQRVERGESVDFKQIETMVNDLGRIIMRFGSLPPVEPGS